MPLLIADKQTTPYIDSDLFGNIVLHLVLRDPPGGRVSFFGILAHLLIYGLCSPCLLQTSLILVSRTLLALSYLTVVVLAEYGVDLD